MNPDLALAVLDLATEDYYGLWELLWRKSELASSPAGSPSLTEVRAVVQELLRRGMVELYRGARFNGDEKPIEPRAASAALEDDQNWVPPEQGASHIRVTVTAAGEEEYRRLFRKLHGNAT